MAQIGCFLWALFFGILAYSMMPGYITAVIVISFIGGLMDGIRRNKKRKGKEKREKQKRR